MAKVIYQVAMDSYKQVERIIFFAVCWFLTFFKPVTVPQTLLLVRVDGIGDYVLFRNFIEKIKKSKKYRNYKITLVGNQAWSSVSEHLDSEFIDHFIWLDIKKFACSSKYRIEKLIEIRSVGYELAWHPVYSRQFLLGDLLMRFSSAKRKIGVSGDQLNMSKWQKRIGDRWYTELTPNPDESLHEFDRNKALASAFIEEPINHLEFCIQKINSIGNGRLPIDKNFAAVFIGANNKFRKWSPEGYAKVADYLSSHYGFDIVLLGGPGEIEDAKIFDTAVSVPYLNLVGKTSLVELVSLLKNIDILVSNDTSAPHFAVALGVEHIFVISNGNHFGRYVPYPGSIHKCFEVILPYSISSRVECYAGLQAEFARGSRLDIDSIEPSQVTRQIDAMVRGDDYAKTD